MDFDLTYLYEDTAPSNVVEVDFTPARDVHPDNQHIVRYPSAKILERLRSKMGDTIMTNFLVWIEKAQENSNAHYGERFPTIGGDELSFEVGRKYVRVIKHSGNGQTFVVCFITMEDGTIWKPDGYKKPTLNFSRGNIADLKTAEFRYGF